MTASTPAPGPRVVEVHEIVDGWSGEVRQSFAYWVGQMAPELVDEYDAIIRRLEAAQLSRVVRHGVKAGLTPS